MTKIRIVYFHGTKFPNLPYEHNSTYEFSKRRRNRIIDVVMEAGYNILLQKISDEWLIIWIDNKRFQQR